MEISFSFHPNSYTVVVKNFAHETKAGLLWNQQKFVTNIKTNVTTNNKITVMLTFNEFWLQEKLVSEMGLQGQLSKLSSTAVFPKLELTSQATDVSYQYRHDIIRVVRHLI